MSYCAIIAFKNGKPEGQYEFGNSWGGAAYIWTALFDKYMKDPDRPHDSWLSRGDQPGGDGRWEVGLVKGTLLSHAERVVLLATLNRPIVLRQNFSRFASDLRDFLELHPVPKDHVNHLEAWAAQIEACEFDAIGFWHTSVGENPWAGWDEEKDEETLFDLNASDDWFEVYEYAAKLAQDPPDRAEG